MNNTIIGIVVAVVVVFALMLVILFATRRKKKGASSSASENAQVYVGNLAYRVHERELRRFFGNYGTISHLKVVKDRNTGRSKGFGFVTYEDANQAAEALKAHGENLFGRNIVVRLAKPRT